MRVLADSVGKMPLNAFVLTVVVCAIINVAMFAKTHRYGPSIVISGLKAPAVLRLHQIDDNYALAMAKRFCHEYYNWSYVGHMRAKLRAAYLTDDATAELIISAAKQKNPYYQRMLCTSNAAPDKATVLEHDVNEGRYVIDVTFKVKEWQSFIPTEYEVKAMIVLERQNDLNKRPFLLEVTNYEFKAQGEPKVLEVEKDDEQRILWVELENAGRIEDRRRETVAKYVHGARIENEDTREWEVIEDVKKPDAKTDAKTNDKKPDGKPAATVKEPVVPATDAKTEKPLPVPKPTEAPVDAKPAAPPINETSTNQKKGDTP